MFSSQQSYQEDRRKNTSGVVNVQTDEESMQTAGKPDNRKRILVVDDDKLILRVAETILEDDYIVDCVNSGEEALAFLGRCLPDLILLDLYMAGMDGRETINCMMASEVWQKIPVICLTADTKPETETECLNIGASDFITKPFVPQVVRSRISRTLELNDLRNDLETRLAQKTKLVEKVTLNSIMAIANTIDVKDAYTSGHSFRVARCAEAIARKLGWCEEEVQNIHYIALLHDIGKIGIPDAILNKPNNLSEEEFAIIRKHPIIGNEILKDIHMIEHVAEGALYHHEHYDGSGYPFGLKGEDIPICARIVGIADSYDAMTSNRVYHPRLKDEEVIAEFERGSGTQFDPQLVGLFVEMLKGGFHVPYGLEANISDREEDDIVGDSNKLLNKFLTEYAAELKNNAMKDSLTGLYNRAYAESCITRMLKTGNSGSLFMIDLDNFKYINDTYGHIAGDVALKNFSEVLLKHVDKSDVVCRIGGDEFIIFFKNMVDRDKVDVKAREILKMLTQALSDMQYDKIASVSIGIATHPYDGNTYEALYNNADKALYYVKKNGKNAFCFYSDEERISLQNKTATDLSNIRNMMEGRINESPGVYHVEYDEFKKLYNYITRYVKRNQQDVQILLFTLSANERAPYVMVPNEAMNALELSVISSLRMVDVGTRYSSVQYMVILLDTNEDNGKKVAGRVVDKFYKNYSGSDVDIAYDIQTLQPNINEIEEK